MDASEQEAILGLDELEQALKFYNLKKYDQSETLLKAGLKILKNAKHAKSLIAESVLLLAWRTIRLALIAVKNGNLQARLAGL